MDFKKRINVRKITAVVLAVLGILLILLGLFGISEHASSFGTVFLAVSLARLKQISRITKSEDSFKSAEIRETDERNIFIALQARSLASVSYITISGFAIVILYLFKKDELANLLCYNLCAFTLIHWICYFFIKRKY